MWPVSNQQIKDDDGAAAPAPVETVEETSTDLPADAEERTPEEAGYGYGV